MEMVTQTCHGNFKIKACLKDDDVYRCFHFASMILDRGSLNRYIDPDRWIFTSLMRTCSKRCFEETLEYSFRYHEGKIEIKL